MSFNEAYQEFLLLGTKHLKKQSLDTLECNFNNHILIYFKDYYLSDITKSDILKWKNSIYSFNFSNSFNNTLYTEFNSFLNYCVDNNYISFNFLKDIGNFKKKFQEPNYDFYTLSEFNIFIKGVSDNIYKQFFTLLFYTGCRPGEAMALRFSDLTNDSIIIRHNITSKHGRELVSPKNFSSYRIIKLDYKLYKDIIKLKFFYDSKFNIQCFDYYIFGGIKPLAPTTINRIKLKSCNEVGIRPITLHQFRHSHATLLMNHNIMINEISKRLGHSKVSTTLDIYIHTNFLQEKRVIKTLNSLRFNFLDTLECIFKKFISILKHF